MTSGQPRPFGQLLKRHRIAAGLTQEALAARAGLAARSISDMERELRRAPYHDSVSKLAEALQLSPAERAQFEAAARRPGTFSARHSPGAPAGMPLTSPETPAGDTPLPGAASLAQAPSAEWGIGAPAEMGNSPSSAGTLPPTPGPGGVPLTTLFRPIPGGAGRLIVAAFAAARGRGTLVSWLVSVLLVGILFGGTLFSTGATAQHPRPGGGKLCLATEFPTTGDWGHWGISLEHAVDLAVQQNQSLGNGYTLAAIHYSEVSAATAQRDPQQGAHNATDIVQTPCILGMVGPAWSRVALLEMPITANAGLVMISPANTMPGLTMRLYAAEYGLNFDQLHPPGKKTNYFRTIANDAFQGRELADLASRQPPAGLGARSAFVVDDHTPYGEVVVGGFTQEWLAKDGTIVGTDGIPFGGAARIAELAARIVATRSDVVCYGGTVDGGGGLLKAQLAQAGYTGLFVGGDGITGALDAAFIDQVGTTAASDVFAINPVPDPSTFTAGAAARFVRDYHAKYPGEDLDGYSANAYDAAMLLITAIKRLIQAGQAVTRQAVRDQVQNIQYVGVTGPISFDHNGDNAHGVFSVYTVQDGKWVWVKQESV